MRRLSIAVWFGALAALGFSCGHSKDGDSSDRADEINAESFDTREAEQDAKFVVNAVATNFANIKFARLAMLKSNDVHIKEIAQTMEKDDSIALRSLKGLANKKGISIPMEEDKDSREDAAELVTKKQSDFNKGWLTELEDHHKETIRDFEIRWKNTKDEDLKSWINNTLPGLRSHLDMISSYREQVR